MRRKEERALTTGFNKIPEWFTAKIVEGREHITIQNKLLHLIPQQSKPFSLAFVINHNNLTENEK